MKEQDRVRDGPERHQSLLNYANYRYLKVALLMLLLTIGAYVWYRPPTGRNGNTAMGYALGTIGALMILWLLWFGVRKRKYAHGAGMLLGWLSAHVYLGVVLVVVATLHASFQAGWNVHTLAYVLMLFVVLSGIYGVIMYARVPRVMTANMGDDTQPSLLMKIADLDKQARELALGLPDAFNNVVLAAAEQTRVGGSWWRQLSGRDPDCATAKAAERLQQMGKGLRGADARTTQQIYTLLVRKQDMLARARRDVACRARLEFWLYIHVPLSVALLAALIAHVVSVFFYW